LIACGGKGHAEVSIMNMEKRLPMFTPKAIGFVRSQYRESAEIPKGLGARHDAVGAL